MARKFDYIENVFATFPPLPRRIAERAPQRNWPPIGFCIYCGTTRYEVASERPLGGEHIVPESLGGFDVIQEASCKKCEALTSSFERIVSRTEFDALRTYLDLPSKRPKSRPTRREVVFQDFGGDWKTQQIPAVEYPLQVAYFEQNPPGLLAKPTHQHRTKLTVWYPMGPRFHKMQIHRVGRAIGKGMLRIDNTVLDDEIIYLVAKIAYCYAIVAFGVSYVEYLVRKPIIQKDIKHLYKLAGFSLLNFGKSEHLHEISFYSTTRGNKRLLVVTVWLFACLDGPRFDIVVGRYYPPEGKGVIELGAN